LFCLSDNDTFIPDIDFIRRTTMVHIEDRLRQQMSGQAANDILRRLPLTIFPTLEHPYLGEVRAELNKYEQQFLKFNGKIAFRR